MYATATGANRMVTLDEDTGRQLAEAPTGDYPDGLAYDPDHHTIWTTNETGGSETVIDADTNQIRGTVQLGGEAGNVYYDPIAKQTLVDVQTRNELAVIDTATMAITRRVPRQLVRAARRYPPRVGRDRRVDRRQCRMRP